MYSIDMKCIYIYYAYRDNRDTPKQYMYTYIHTYLPTYILTYVLTYILTYLHTYILTYIHTYIRPPAISHSHGNHGPFIFVVQ
jgi:hypothetical protein